MILLQAICHVATFTSITMLLFSISVQSKSREISASASCRPRERDALLDFVLHALEADPGHAHYDYWFSSGPHSTGSDAAAEAYDCCLWKGVACDERGMVTGIDLHNCGNNAHKKPVRGEMNSEALTALAAIDRLSTLDLGCQSFHGPIAADIGNLTSLAFLRLSHNNLSGLLPPSLQRLKSLRHLDLSNNQFSPQEIPSSLLKLPSLLYLDLSSNSFIGIQSFSSCPYSPTDPSLSYDSQSQLRYLNLSSNELIESIFNGSTFRSLKNLTVLDLSNNQLQGTFPTVISSSGAFLELMLLNMNNNRLGGRIPDFLRHLKRIQALDLGANELSGSIPEWLSSNFLRDLRILILAGNHLTGTMPASLGLFSHVQILDLSDNQLSGPIPPEMGQLKGLLFLNLSSNRLLGEIPGTIGNLTHLELLDLSENMLQGRIPGSFNDLEAVRFVNLSSNHLSGNVPSSPHWLDTVDESAFRDNDGLCTTSPIFIAQLPLCGSGSLAVRSLVMSNDGSSSSSVSESVDDSAITVVNLSIPVDAESIGFAVGYPLGVLLAFLLYIRYLR